MANGLNINNNFYNDYALPVLMGAKTAQNLYRKTSISALAKDLILQYPVLISGDIDFDTAITISKALELQYASLQVLVLSADTAFGVDPMKNAGVRDMLSRYHSNSDTPDMINYAGNLFYNVSTGLQTITEDVSPDATFKITKATESSRGCDKAVVDSLWEKTENQIERSVLNDLYSPGKALVKTVESVADAAEARVEKAMEDKNEFFEDFIENTFVGKKNADGTFDRYGSKYGPKPYDPNVRDAKSGKPLPGPGVSKLVVDFPKEYSKLEPTMIEMEFFVANGDHSRTQKAIIGVSAMPRMVPSAAMRTNVIKSFQHTHNGLKFIQYTRGERKVVKDFIFNVTNIKEDALAKSKYDKWFAALRKRKMNSKIFKGGNANINPLATLVLTKNDVAMIKQASGFDISDERTAIKLMDSLYLLCLVIVDTDTETVSTLLDGQNYFLETTIKSLKKGNKDGNVDIANIRETLKLLGR